MTSLPPGWYPDPGSRSRRRWWDGAAWTEHVAQPLTPERRKRRPSKTFIWILVAIVVVLIGAVVVFPHIPLAGRTATPAPSRTASTTTVDHNPIVKPSAPPGTTVNSAEPLGPPLKPVGAEYAKDVAAVTHGLAPAEGCVGLWFSAPLSAVDSGSTAAFEPLPEYESSSARLLATGRDFGSITAASAEQQSHLTEINSGCPSRYPTNFGIVSDEGGTATTDGVSVVYWSHSFSTGRDAGWVIREVDARVANRVVHAECTDVGVDHDKAISTCDAWFTEVYAALRAE